MTTWVTPSWAFKWLAIFSVIWRIAALAASSTISPIAACAGLGSVPEQVLNVAVSLLLRLLIAYVKCNSYFAQQQLTLSHLFIGLMRDIFSRSRFVILDAGLPATRITRISRQHRLLGVLTSNATCQGGCTIFDACGDEHTSFQYCFCTG